MINEGYNSENQEVTIGSLLSKGNEVLKESGIDTYILDSQLLMAKVLGRDRLEVLMNRKERVSEAQADGFLKLISLRKNRMPVKYILEECEFMGLRLYVKEGVLIPRPDTETLVEAAVTEIRDKKYRTIADVCSGTGAIGLTVASEVKDTVVECFDISDTAEEVSKINIRKLDLQDRVSFFKSDLLDKAILAGKEYDVILSNPPYIPEDVIPTLMEDVRDYEPYIALSGGQDGLDFYRRIINESLRCLKKGGLIAFEIGHDQREAVSKLLEQNNYTEIECIKDLAGMDRVVKGIKP